MKSDYQYETSQYETSQCGTTHSDIEVLEVLAVLGYEINPNDLFSINSRKLFDHNYPKEMHLIGAGKCKMNFCPETGKPLWAEERLPIDVFDVATSRLRTHVRQLEYSVFFRKHPKDHLSKCDKNSGTNPYWKPIKCVIAFRYVSVLRLFTEVSETSFDKTSVSHDKISVMKAQIEALGIKPYKFGLHT